MNSRPVKSRRNLPILAASIAVLLSAMPDRAQAAALTWDGDQDGNWNTDNSGNTNWGNAGSILPVNGDTLTFTGTSNTSTTNNITGLTIGTGSGTAITLTNTAPSTAFTLAGNSITLAGNIVTTTSGGPAAATHTISLDMILNGNRLITAVTDSHLTVSGVISNDGTNRDLTKEGAGILTLSGNNSYGGNTTVGNAATGGGTLVLGHNSALGGSGTLTVTGTGTIIELQNGITISNNATYSNSGNNKILRGAASAVAEYAGSITVNETAATNFDISGGTGGTLTVSGQITSTSGAGVSITGGTVVLSNGSNSISGNTDVTSGTLRLGHNAAAGASTIRIVGSTTNLELADGLNVANALTITDVAQDGSTQTTGKTLRLLLGATSAEYSGSITISESTAGNFDLNANGGTLTLSGQITGSGGAGMQTAGTAGTIILSNNTNNYTGVTDLALTGSVLRVTAANALGATGVGNGTTVVSGAALQLQGGNIYAAELLNLAGTGVSNTGALRNVSGANTWTGNITLTANTEIQSDAGTLTLDVASGDAITGTFNLTLDSATSAGIEVADVIATGTGTFTKSGAGTLTLSAANSFSGAVVMNSGTTIVNNIQDAGTASSLGTGGTTPEIRMGNAGNTATLRCLGTSAASTNRQIIIGNAGTGGGIIENDSVSSSHTLTFSNAAFNSPTAAVTQTRTLTLGGSNPGANTISGVIADNDTGTGGLIALTKSGSGLWELGGANTYTGATTVNGGTLRVLSTSNISSVGTTTISQGTLNLQNTAQTLAATTLGNASASGTASLTLAVGTTVIQNGNLTYTANSGGHQGIISGGTIDLGAGAGNVTRTWTVNDTPGLDVDLTVSSALNFTTAGTKIWVISNDGRVEVTGANSIPAATTTRIQANGTLRVASTSNIGTGTADIRYGTLEMNNSQTLGQINLGQATAGNGNAALVIGSGQTVTMNGNLTYAADDTTANLGTVSGGTLDLGSGSGNRTLTVGDNTLVSGAELTISSVISSSGTRGITKAGTGHLALTNTNTYSGATTITAGTLEAAAAGALGGTSGLTVNTGGTLLLSNTGTTDRINNSATMTLAGGTIAFSGNVTEGSSPGTGALTLTASSVIDFLGGNAIINFDDSSSASWSAFTLSIWNWGGSYAGGGSDQLKFGTGSSALTAGQLSQISFYSDNGSTFLGTGGFVGSLGEVVPVPEPMSVCVALGLFGLAARRELGRSARRRRAIVSGI
jgi:autotransporter-associated beta strand protein